MSDDGLPTEAELFESLPHDLREVLGPVPTDGGTWELLQWVRAQIAAHADAVARGEVEAWIESLEDDPAVCGVVIAESTSFRDAVRTSWQGRTA